jgi:transposase
MHIVSDSVWNVIKNLLPQKKSSVGRPRLDQKKVFEGIVFKLTLI